MAALAQRALMLLLLLLLLLSLTDAAPNPTTDVPQLRDLGKKLWQLDSCLMPTGAAFWWQFDAMVVASAVQRQQPC
jgi:hypothetical protein